LDVHRRVSLVPENHVIGSDDRITLLKHFSCQSAVRHCNSIFISQSNIQYYHHHSSSGHVSPFTIFETRQTSFRFKRTQRVRSNPGRYSPCYVRVWAPRGSRVSVPSQHHPPHLSKRATCRTPDPSALLRSMSRPSRHPPAVAVVHRPRGSLPGMQLLGFERTPPNTTAPLPPILSTVLATPQIHTHDNQTTRNHDHTPI
jgi:hypothetical protein